MNKVYARLPKAGLGNMLLVWAKALVFARINGFPLITSSWWGLHWGALLRREKKSRLYFGYFKETSIWKQWVAKCQLPFYEIIHEPKLSSFSGNSDHKVIYVFNKVITNEHPFGSLRSYKDVISQELMHILTNKMKNRLQACKAPVMGVHIRRGDFKLGSTLTGIDFFVKGIKIIRHTAGHDFPVTVFTDAYPEEIDAVLSMPNVLLANDNADIVDILLLSQSKIILTSGGSTFSYWSAFLSNAFVIKPSFDWIGQIKEDDLTAGYREVTWDHKDTISTDELKVKFKSYINGLGEEFNSTF